MSNQVNLSNIIMDNFKDFHKALKTNDYLHYVLKGGRNSGKSFQTSVELILAAVKYPISILCVRKVERTLEGSVFEQLREAIEVLGLTSVFKVSKSPLKLTYIPRGNSIIFRGADDPAKIKSIKMSKYPIAYLWFEEVAEFKTEEDIRVVINSVLRDELKDGLSYKFFYTYNPPKRRNHWVNKLWGDRKTGGNTFIHYSTYMDNKYISKSALYEIEQLKQRNINSYKWEYLGEPIGNGVVPFNNLTFREITNEEIENFDNLRAGVDWGYSTDPASYVLWHYDKTRRTIYGVAEVYQVKLSNRELYDKIREIGNTDIPIIADSAEPKSVDELRSYGLLVRGAKKPKGSVEYGEKWLDDLDAIIIDPKRTPNIAREFEEIDYKVDASGNTIPKLDEFNNHTIDATRYAFQEDMRTSRGEQNENKLYDEDGNLTSEGKYQNILKDIVGSGVDKNFFKGGI